MMTGNEYLQNFELANILPAVVVGYLLSGHFRRFAAYGWVLPTVVLCYKLLTFAEPESSVLAAHSSTRFAYFFVIQRTIPTFTPGFGGVDPIRVAQQMFVVAPFYSSLAYTFGALAGSRNLLDRLFRRSTLQVEPERLEIDELPEQPEHSERPVHELN